MSLAAHLSVSPEERRLLQEGRMTGPMPWVIAIMIFLTVLAAAAGLLLSGSLRMIGSEVERRVTVQLVDADAARGAAHARAVVAALAGDPLIARQRVVDPAQSRSAIADWLGDDRLLDGLPLPALIDIDLTRTADPATIAALQRRVAAVAPDARIEPHARWMTPVERLIGSALYLAVALVLLLAAAAVAVVLLATRSALSTHAATIEVLHLVGATDAQIARLFQRRIAIDALYAALAGTLLAIGVILVAGRRFAALDPAIVAQAGAGIGWLWLLVIPLAIVLLASLTARWAILAALKKRL